MPESSDVYLAYAGAYLELGQNASALEAAIRTLDKATTINRTGLHRFYIYRGLASLELGNADEAVKDLETAVVADNKSYEENLGLVRAFYLQERFGSAFLKVEALKFLAKTDEQKAIMLYWRALVQEQHGETKDAVKAWNELLDMDKDVITSEMLNKAEERLKVLVPPTPTPRTNATPSPTGTP